MEHLPSALAAWESFYVIVGSSGAALTGLQFVVIALIADQHAARGTQEIAAFGTPTIVHFCEVLLIAGVLSAPWPSLGAAGAALAAMGTVGLGWATVTLRRARRQRGYQPVLEDWIWHVALPLAANLAIFLGGVGVARRPGGALFAVAAASLLLLLVGIHNAWDTVTYIALVRRGGEEQPAAVATAAAPTPDADTART